MSTIDYIKQYEKTKAKQHPVGMTVEWPGGNNDVLLASPADWISPNPTGGYQDDPPANSGQKVGVRQTQNSLWGIGGNVPWAWKSLTRGLNTLFMDPYDCSPFWPPVPCDTSTWDIACGRIWDMLKTYRARLMNLGQALPHGELCSTGYCLVNLSPGDTRNTLCINPNVDTSLTVEPIRRERQPAGRVAEPGQWGAECRSACKWGRNGEFHTAIPAAPMGRCFSYTNPPRPLLQARLPPPYNRPATPQPTNTPKPQGTVHPTATPQAITPTAFIYLPGVEGREQGATVPQ